LGSGLSERFAQRDDLAHVTYDRLPGSPQAHLEGHPGVALVGTWNGVRVVLFAGRVHLYQGFSPQEVTYFVRLAAAAGAGTLVLTNAAGGLAPELAPGDIMLISDQINWTGASPLIEREQGPFIDMVDAYAPSLRALARNIDPTLRDGVYAGVRGPCYETPAEAAALRTLGADAVGMSTVLETIAARALGLNVLGLSSIANTLASAAHTTHTEVVAASQRGSERFAALVETVVRSIT
jgi:purine-nucleoside phosphorylase